MDSRLRPAAGPGMTEEAARTLAMLRPALAALVAIGIGAPCATSYAYADAVEDFYKGKTVTVVTSTGVGGRP